MKKCPSSIWRWDSNPRPLENESSPITTRPGLLFKLDSNFEYDALLLCKCRPKYQKKIKSFLEKYFSTDVTGNKLPQLIHFFLVSWLSSKVVRSFAQSVSYSGRGLMTQFEVRGLISLSLSLRFIESLRQRQKKAFSKQSDPAFLFLLVKLPTEHSNTQS